MQLVFSYLSETQLLLDKFTASPEIFFIGYKCKSTVHSFISGGWLVSNEEEILLTCSH